MSNITNDRVPFINNADFFIIYHNNRIIFDHGFSARLTPKATDRFLDCS